MLWHDECSIAITISPITGGLLYDGGVVVVPGDLGLLRWSVEIEIWEAVESYGLGQDRCRRYERIVGANAFRLMMAAAQGLWFAQQLAQGQVVDLVRYRPWYQQKRAPSGFDIMWACRERLFEEGIIPTVGFWEKVGVIELVSPAALPRAA